MSASATIRVDDAGELIASVPTLVGFTPAASLVTITLRENKVGLVVRTDLPGSSDAPQLVAQLAQAHARAHAEAVIAVVVDATCRRSELAAALSQALAAHHIALPAAYQVGEFTAGTRWRSLLEPTVTGALPDPKGTQVAAALVAQGRVTHASREALAAVLAPDGEEITARRAGVIEDLLREQPGNPEAAAAVVRTALQAARSGALPQTDRQVAELAVALTDPQVRDACLATALPAGAGLAEAGARLWQALTRACPAPERAAPATLAAYAAYADGNGALAGIALDTALAADPDYLLATFLQHALRAGLPPQRLRALADNDSIDLLDDPTEAARPFGRDG